MEAKDPIDTLIAQDRETIELEIAKKKKAEEFNKNLKKVLTVSEHKFLTSEVYPHALGVWITDVGHYLDVVHQEIIAKELIVNELKRLSKKLQDKE